MGGITAYYDIKQYKIVTGTSLYQDIKATELRISFPTQSIEFVAGLVNIYIVIMLQRVNQATVSKDDPMDNGIVICFLIFFLTV